MFVLTVIVFRTTSNDFKGVVLLMQEVGAVAFILCYLDVNKDFCVHFFILCVCFLCVYSVYLW